MSSRNAEGMGSTRGKQGPWWTLKTTLGADDGKEVFRWGWW